MTVRLASSADLEPFFEFLRAVRVRVLGVHGSDIKVAVPNAPSSMHERRELTGCVVTWNALNPGRMATLADC